MKINSVSLSLLEIGKKIHDSSLVLPSYRIVCLKHITVCAFTYCPMVTESSFRSAL